jgi:mRNA interferase YafQ
VSKKKAEGPEPARPPLKASRSTRFVRDVQRMKKRGGDMDKLKAVIDALASRQPLPEEYRDHALKAEWIGWRDCHVAPDWIVIYRKTDAELILGRTGTHSDLF